MTSDIELKRQMVNLISDMVSYIQEIQQGMIDQGFKDKTMLSRLRQVLEMMPTKEDKETE